MKMYAAYLKEHCGDELLEDSRGFAVYRYLSPTSVYIIDIYISPDFRRGGAASALADRVVGIAKQRGCTELLGTVVPSANNSTESLRVLVGYGMRLKSATENLIIFSKDI